MRSIKRSGTGILQSTEYCQKTEMHRLCACGLQSADAGTWGAGDRIGGAYSVRITDQAEKSPVRVVNEYQKSIQSKSI